jgi:hypothetical protein
MIPVVVCKDHFSNIGQIESLNRLRFEARYQCALPYPAARDDHLSRFGQKILWRPFALCNLRNVEA